MKQTRLDPGVPRRAVHCGPFVTAFFSSHDVLIGPLSAGSSVTDEEAWPGLLWVKWEVSKCEWGGIRLGHSGLGVTAAEWQQEHQRLCLFYCRSSDPPTFRTNSGAHFFYSGHPVAEFSSICLKSYSINHQPNCINTRHSSLLSNRNKTVVNNYIPSIVIIIIIIVLSFLYWLV